MEFVSPYEVSYIETEMNLFKTLNDTTFGNVHLFTQTGRDTSAYLHNPTPDERTIAVLQIDGKTWMSMARVEIESHAIPIQFAKGHVGVAGLGMGYYVQRILNKPDVERVTVFELNPNVIAYYNEAFGMHEKLEIIECDATEIEGYTFDYFYNDIYLKMNEFACLEDMTKIVLNNQIEKYHFWGMEKGFVQWHHVMEDLISIPEVYEMLKDSMLMYDAVIQAYPENHVFIYEQELYDRFRSWCEKRPEQDGKFSCMDEFNHLDELYFDLNGRRYINRFFNLDVGFSFATWIIDGEKLSPSLEECPTLQKFYREYETVFSRGKDIRVEYYAPTKGFIGFFDKNLDKWVLVEETSGMF